MMRRLQSFLVFAILLAVSTTSAKEPVAERPVNLLVIQTDEHNFRTLGCYRETLPEEQAYIWGKDAVVETPHIDSIAKQGALCTSFYATSPVCTPSRASFFTGLYPHNTGSPQNNLPMKNEMITFAKVLLDNGYQTGYAGKWHLDGNGKPQWAPERKFGFADNRFMFNRGHWKKFEITKDGPRVGALSKGAPSYGLAGADETTFATDWLASRAIDFIRKNADQPFCYHLSLPDPHGPNTVRAPYDRMFADTPIRAPMTFSMAKDNPAWATTEGKNSVGTFRADAMSQYFGMVKCIDDNVGRILQTLDELGISQNTAIVITSDHGDLCYEHGRLNKGNPYEGSAKIPMIVLVPGKVPAKTIVHQALGTVDFVPTILPLLGFKAPPAVEGRDFGRLLLGDAAGWKDVSVLRNAGVKPAWVAGVSDRFKLVVSMNETPWLFDLEQDPDELKNYFGKPDTEAVCQSLASALLEYGEQNNDPFIKGEGTLRTQLLEIADN